MSRDKINDLFTRSPENGVLIAKSENESIEHKESFSFNAALFKTCAAFANNRGGYIIFGIADGTGAVKGLNDKHFKRFQNYDLRKATQVFHNLFSPNIRIDKGVHEVNGKRVGMIYVYESEAKPVISINNNNEASIADGEIYFSYAARREKIRSAELQKIISDRIQKSMERIARLTHIAIAKGPENIAVFDAISGEGIGPNAHPFVVDKSALDSISVITEGGFSETEGAPALRLVADVTTIIDERIVQRDRDIDKDSIVYTFLDQEAVPNPELFLSAMSKHDVTYAPLYYFAHLAEFNEDEVRNLIGNVDNRRKDTARQLLDRLQREKQSAQSIEPATFRINRSSSYFAQLGNKKHISIDEDNFKPVMAAIRSLEPEEIDKEYILEITRNLYQYMAKMDSPYKTDMRKVICYLDRALYPLH